MSSRRQTHNTRTADVTGSGEDPVAKGRVLITDFINKLQAEVSFRASHISHCNEEDVEGQLEGTGSRLRCFEAHFETCSSPPPYSSHWTARFQHLYQRSSCRWTPCVHLNKIHSPVPKLISSKASPEYRMHVDTVRNFHDAS